MAVIFILAALAGIAAALIWGTSLYFRVSLNETGAHAAIELRLLFGLIRLPVSARKKHKKSEAKKRYSAHKLLDIPRLEYLRVTSRVGLEDAANTALLAGFIECAVKAALAPFADSKSRICLWIRPLFGQDIFWLDLEGIIVVDVSQIMPISKRSKGRK